MKKKRKKFRISERTLNRLISVYFIVAIILMLSPLVVIEFSLFYPSLFKYVKVSFACILIYGAFCPVVMILMDKIPLKSSAPFRFKLNFKDYNSINSYLKNMLFANNYKFLCFKNRLTYEVNFYYKQYSLSKIDVIAVIYTKQYEEKILNEIYDELDRVVKDNNFDKSNNFYFIPIFIVDNNNEAFKKYIRMPLAQTRHNYLLPVGYLISNTTLYIINQNNDIYIGKYLELKKRFIKTIKLKKLLKNENE